MDPQKLARIANELGEILVAKGLTNTEVLAILNAIRAVVLTKLEEEIKKKWN